MRRDVAALYVDRAGPYPSLVVDWFDEERDARTYVGSLPVVAHPPCGPWGRLKFLCTKQPKWAGPHAVEVVRKNGGVLEHPADSSLWEHCGLPRPGELPDAWGGWSLAVRQVSWGHRCEKPTWLYLVGVDSRLVARTLRSGGVATHRVTNGPRGNQALKRETQPHLTPPEFAAWLVELAASVRRREAAAS